jgi:hypothetical protein
MPLIYFKGNVSYLVAILRATLGPIIRYPKGYVSYLGVIMGYLKGYASYLKAITIT